MKSDAFVSANQFELLAAIPYFDEADDIIFPPLPLYDASTVESLLMRDLFFQRLHIIYVKSS